MTTVSAPNPSSEAKRGVEVRLDSLPAGARFRSNPIQFGGFTYRGLSGTFLYANQSRARVRIHSAQPDRKFKAGSGQEVVLPGQNYRETDWAPDTPVEYLDMDPNYKVVGKTPKVNGLAISDVFLDEAVDIKFDTKKETVMTAASANISVEVPANASAFAIKWKFNLAALKKALATDTASAIAVGLRDKIQAVYDESVEAGVSLDPPDFNDPIFADMVFEKARVPQPVAAPGTIGDAVVTVPSKSARSKKAPVPASVKGAEAVAARQAAKTASKVAQAKGKDLKAQKKGVATATTLTKKAKGKLEKAAKADAPKVAKVAKTLNKCHDGCGESVKGNFKQGHDARYKSLILQVQREELDATKLPKYMTEHGGVDGQPLVFVKVKDGYKCTNSVAKLK